MAQNEYMYLTGRRSYFAEFSQSFGDFGSAFSKWRLALSLAVHDIAARYRGSVLGPWWITLTMGALIVGIGVNYASLFKVAVREFLPYVAIGIVMWGFISTSITEGAEAFVSAGAMLRQSAMPLPLFIMRCLFRNIINLAHHMVIIVLVLVYAMRFPGLGLVWSMAGLLLTCLNVTWIMVLAAFLSARFRDVPQIITALLQVAFFLTPIFWKVTPSMQHSMIVVFNPFYYCLESIRGPLLDGSPSVTIYAATAASAVVGWALAILVYNQIRRRVVHYL